MFPHHQLGHPRGPGGEGDEGVLGWHDTQWFQELSVGRHVTDGHLVENGAHGPHDVLSESRGKGESKEIEIWR